MLLLTLKFLCKYYIMSRAIVVGEKSSDLVLKSYMAYRYKP